MPKFSFKIAIFAIALTLILFVGLPRAVFAHSLAMAPRQQGQQGDQNNHDDKKDGNQDINDDRQDGPNDDLQEGPNDERNDDRDMDKQEGEQNHEGTAQHMDGDHNDGNFHDADSNEDRVEDQQQDQHEDTPVPPSGF